MSDVKKYEYQAQFKVMILVILFFGACAIMLGIKASQNDVGLIVIDGVIELSERGADMFHWGMFLCALAFVAIGVIAIVQRVSSEKGFLEIHKDYFVLPKLGFSPEKKIFFNAVTDIKEQNISGAIITNFITPDMKVAVSNRNFKSKAEYTEARNVLLEKFQSA